MSREDRVVIGYVTLQGSNSSTQGTEPEYNGLAAYPTEQNYETLKVAVSRVDDSNFRVMQFRNTGQTDSELRGKIQSLFQRAVAHWPGVFSDSATFELTDSHLAVCVSSLQDVKLFDSNLMVLDEAFEYLVVKAAKGEKGQYFTPRHVIDVRPDAQSPSGRVHGRHRIR